MEKKDENKEKRRKNDSKDKVRIIAHPVDSSDEIKVDPSQYCKVPELNESPEWAEKHSLLKGDATLLGSL